MRNLHLVLTSINMIALSVVLQRQKDMEHTPYKRCCTRHVINKTY